MSNEFGDEFTASQTVFSPPPADPFWSRVRSFFRRQIAVIRLAEFGVALAFAIGAWFAGGEMFLAIPAIVFAWGAAFIGLLASNLRGRYVALWAIIIAGALIAEGSVLYWHFHEAHARALLARWSKFQPRPQPPPAPAPNPILQSRAGKMLFTCASPPGDKKAFEDWKRQFKNAANVYGEATGVSILLSDIPKGVKIEMAAKTPEGQARLGAVTKVTIQAQRATDQNILVVYSWEMPSPFGQFLALMPLNADAAETKDAVKMVEKFFGGEGKCQII